MDFHFLAQSAAVCKHTALYKTILTDALDILNLKLVQSYASK